MPTPKIIAELFSEKIDRKIEEVIKVDALDDQTVLEEIQEYYPTASIQTQLAKVLEAYASVRQGETQDIGVWISGFFGAGKSSFAKLLGILLGSRKLGKQDAIDLFGKRITDARVKVLLQQIREHLPTHVVIFDILKDHVAGGAQEHPVTTVMYRALLRSLGYAQDADLAELEINLEERGDLKKFEARYADLYPGRAWEQAKLLVMTAVNEASAVLHSLDSKTYPAPDSWARSRARAAISPRELAKRSLKLAEARAQGRNVVFVVDEMGQYTARELPRIGDLQGIVESLGQVGKGKLWLIATSQEKLEAIVDIYEQDRPELARLQDRFSHKVFLQPSDIREVASHRVLAKNGQGDQILRGLYEKGVGQLKMATSVSGPVQLPQLEEDTFVHLYPLLPYQVDLLIDVVSGLRRQGGGPQTLGGANRTIIKLAQQLLVHPKVGLAREPVGKLVRLDGAYELIATNVATEIQQEIDDIERQVKHPYAGPVAKALALLQFAESVYTTEENLAAVLHPAIDAKSVLPDVRDAVEMLIKARKIRRTERGLKIQSAVERTWDEERDSRRPSSGDRQRIMKETLEQIWGSGPQAPSHQLGGWKKFTAGLRIGNETLVDGDLPFEVRIADPTRSSEEQAQEARAATQREETLVAWLVDIPGDAEDAVVERYRSDRMLTRGSRTKDEDALLREEGRRKAEADRKLRAELERAMCRGKVFFRGNDRSPSDDASDPRGEARRILGPALEAVFHRFPEGSVRVKAADAEAILKSESLAGLPTCYADLGLVQTVDGQPRLVTDGGAAKTIFDWVAGRCDLGQAPSGKELEQEFNGAPFGWSLELVQLIVGTLLRNGQIILTAQGEQIKNALTPEARKELTNNPRFRALTVRVRERTLDGKKLVAAARALEQRFGHKCPALTPESVAAVLRERMCSEIRRLEDSRDALRILGLPGESALGQALDALRVIREDDDEDAVQHFLESIDTLAKAIPRGRVLQERLTEGARAEFMRARAAATEVGPVLERELGEEDQVSQAARRLRDNLGKETFYDHLPVITSDTRAVLDGFAALYQRTFDNRKSAYDVALKVLYATPGWVELDASKQAEVASRLRQGSALQALNDPWHQAGSILDVLRAQTDGVTKLLADALQALQFLIAPEAVRIEVRKLLEDPIRTADDLDSALAVIRAEVQKALTDGKPVLLV